MLVGSQVSSIGYSGLNGLVEWDWFLCLVGVRSASQGKVPWFCDIVWVSGDQMYLVSNSTSGDVHF